MVLGDCEITLSPTAVGVLRDFDVFSFGVVVSRLGDVPGTIMGV